MTPLLIREFSINHGAGAADKTAALFRRHIPLLYTVSVYFAAFVAVESDKAALILGGDKFAGASAAVMIMALYPAHQTCGQLSGSYFLASGKTALYRNIGIFVLLMGLPMTYFAVAPARLLGFDGGAAGLAVKNVLQNIISVNILIFFICRELRLRFSWFLINQALCMGVFLCLALGARGLTAILLNGAGALSAFFCSGVIYTGLAAAFCALFPHIAGISREELFAELSSALKHIRSGNG
jgi:O-antigen/teichoic acid export membrane protein